YLAANISYKLKSGFWAGTTLYHIKGIQNYIDETNLSAGWDFNLTGRLDGSLSYTRYIYGSDNPLLQSVASNLAMGYLGYDWSFVYSSLTASYLFGEFNDVFLGLNNSRYFGKKNIFGSNDYLGIEPTLNLLAGTQFFTETYTTKIETPNNGNKWNGNNGKGNGNNGNNGNGNENNGNGNWNSGNNGNTSTTTTINTIVESKFTLLNYGFTLPLIYGFGNNSFELSWRLLVPTNVPAEFSKKPRSFFTFSYYHSFNL
ncbi:MAG: hypothetical protein JWQ14_2456, partial [Adhaeribacter sp.]|nr:hypothetical protein [Adhaeribacter sp.]